MYITVSILHICVNNIFAVHLFFLIMIFASFLYASVLWLIPSFVDLDVIQFSKKKMPHDIVSMRQSHNRVGKSWPHRCLNDSAYYHSV